MTAGKAVAIGCGVTALVFLVVGAATILWIRHVSQDPQGVAISVEGPLEVPVGEEFTLTLVVENQRPAKPFGLTDIDFDEQYLEGFFVLGTDPPAMSSQHVPIDNTRSFSFNRPVPPATTMRFKFRLRPAKPGIFKGDIDVCEGSQFLTTLAQTLVKEKM
jgi:hypothetical protein